MVGRIYISFWNILKFEGLIRIDKGNSYIFGIVENMRFKKNFL